MAETSATPEAPWANKRQPGSKHLLRKILPWLVIMGVIALIVAGLWPKPIVVETGVVETSALTVTVLEEGKTRVRNRYSIAAPVAGNMQRVTLRPGDAVKANETILTHIEPVTAPLLDPRARTQAEAAVLLQVAAQQKSQQALDAGRAALKRAESERDRIAQEKTAGILSVSEREAIEADAAIKAAEVRALEFALQITEYELAQARAVLARPELTTAENIVAVKSPVSGVVLRVMQESETIVAPGQEIIEVGDPADLEIEAEILSRDAVAIRAGSDAFIEQWGGDDPLKGRVRRVEPAAFTKISALGVEEQRVIVLIDLLNPPSTARALGDRYRVETRIATWHSDRVLIVPSSALFREGNAWKTFVFSEGTARLTPVEIGHSDGRKSEVLSGLSQGDRVIIHAPDTVKDQSAVTER